MKRWQIRLLGMVVFATLVVLTVSYCAPHIQKDLQLKTEKALKEQNLHWANVSVDGRDVTLSGTAPTESQKQAVETITRNVWGTTNISNNIAVADAVEPYTMTINADGSQLNLQGWVSDTETRDAILRRAHNAFGQANVIAELEYGSGQPAGWSNAVGHMLDNLSTLQRGKASFENTRIEISGRGTNPELAQAFENAMMTYQDSGYQVSAQISAPTPPPPEPTCQEKFNALLFQESIQFGANSSVIDKASFTLLNKLTNVAKDCSEAGLLITGHTDSIGGDDSNMELSLKRAEAVVSYLAGNGIPAERLEAKGLGETAPVANNETRKGRAQNRRIEFTVKGI